MIPAQAAQAQDSAGIARCRSLTINNDRLDCYDKLTLPVSPGGNRSYRAISLTDLKLDRDSLRGQRVEVAGTLVPIGEAALLRSSDTDLSPVFVEVKAVPREQRRVLLDRCGIPGCSVIIRGLVGTVMVQTGIVADSLDIQ